MPSARNHRSKSQSKNTDFSRSRLWGPRSPLVTRPQLEGFGTSRLWETALGECVSSTGPACPDDVWIRVPKNIIRYRSAPGRNESSMLVSPRNILCNTIATRQIVGVLFRAEANDDTGNDPRVHVCMCICSLMVLISTCVCSKMYTLVARSCYDDMPHANIRGSMTHQRAGYRIERNSPSVGSLPWLSVPSRHVPNIWYLK